MRVQTKRTFSDTLMTDIDLEKENMIDIYLHTGEENRLVRLANVEGKLIIFAECHDEVNLVEWEGSRPFTKKINQIRDEMEEMI